MPADLTKPPSLPTPFQVASIVAGISGLISAIGTLAKSLDSSAHVLWHLKPWQLGAISALLLLASAWSFVQSRRRRSILAEPGALHLDRSNPAHLKGREIDIERLVDSIRAGRLTFLEGESGSGKSALLQAGLLPRLSITPGFFPILVDSLAGDNWDEAPRRLVAAALQDAMAENLSSQERDKLCPDGVVLPASLMGALENMPLSLGKEPVLLLDQFDDYQIRFLDHFLVRKSWLKPAKLISQNRFWSDLDKLLRAEKLRCLIVTRTDTAGGLASVRFREPETYWLDRLKFQYAAELIATLVGGPEAGVVTDPDRGWTSMEGRLLAELEQAGTVLPQQLRVVLMGLGTLRSRVMTVGTLQRAGGVAGLEASFVQGCIGQASRAARTQPEAVRKVLMGLVDKQSVDAQLAGKTIAQTFARIAEGVPELPANTLAVVLQELEKQEVVRRRGDEEARSSSWLLDHDYLARAVQEVDRRANRWKRELQEGAEKLRQAGMSWAHWWNALLPPRTQLRLLFVRLRGRVRYGVHRRYATISTVRFAPYLLVLGVLVGAHQLDEQYNMHRVVAEQLDRLTFAKNNEAVYGIDVNDAKALVAISSMSTNSRIYALRRMLTDPSFRIRFLRQPDAAVYAVTGSYFPQYEAAVRLLRSVAGMDAVRKFPADEVRAVADAAKVLRTTAGIPLKWWISAVENSREQSAVLTSLVYGLAQSAGGMTAPQTKAVTATFLDAIEQSPDWAGDLQSEFRVLVGKLTAAQAKTVIPAFITAIEKSIKADNGNTSDLLGTLGSALAPLVGRMTVVQAETVTAAFIGYMGRTLPTDNYASEALGVGEPQFIGGMTAEQAKMVIPMLIDAVEKNEKAPVVLDFLAGNLARLSGKLTARQAAKVMPIFFNAIENNAGDPYMLKTLFRGLAPLSGELTATKAKTLIPSLITIIEEKKESIATSNPMTNFEKVKKSDEWLVSMGSDIEPLADRMTPAQTDTVIAAYISAIENSEEEGTDVLDSLGRDLAQFLDRMTTAQRKAAIPTFIDAIQKNKQAPRVLGPLGRAVAPLAASMTAAQTETAAAAFISALKKNKEGFDPPEALGYGLLPLVAAMTTAQAKAVTAAFIHYIQKDTLSLAIPYSTSPPPGGLASLTGKMTVTQAKAVIPAFIRAIKESTKATTVLAALGYNLAPLVGRMEAAQTKTVISAFIGAMAENKGDAPVLDTLESGLAPLESRITASEGLEITRAALQVLRVTRDQDLADRWAVIAAATSHQEPWNARVLLVLRLLDDPLISRFTRRSLVKSLAVSAQSKAASAGSVWDFVAWAAAEAKTGQLPGYPPLSLF